MEHRRLYEIKIDTLEKEVTLLKKAIEKQDLIKAGYREEIAKWIEIMGFHKRWITEEVLIDRYEREGIDGVRTYIGNADALVTSDTLSSEVVELFTTNHMDDFERWNEISHKIVMRTLQLNGRI